MSLEAYASIDEWAVDKNYDDFGSYVGTHPKQAKLENDLEYMAAIINDWIGSGNVLITSVLHLRYVKQLNMEMVDRKYDKQVDRTSHEGRGIYNPHDYLFQAERDKLLRIGVELGYRVAGGTGTS